MEDTSASSRSPSRDDDDNETNKDKEEHVQVQQHVPTSENAMSVPSVNGTIDESNAPKANANTPHSFKQSTLPWNTQPKRDTSKTDSGNGKAENELKENVAGEKRSLAATNTAATSSSKSKPGPKKQRTSDAPTEKGKDFKAKVAAYVEKKMQSEFDGYFEQLGIGSRTLRAINDVDEKFSKAHEKLRNLRYKKLEKLRKQRERSYPVDDSLMQFEPIPPEPVTGDSNTMHPVNMNPGKMILSLTGPTSKLPSDLNGDILSVWSFSKALSLRKFIDVSSKACGEHMLQNFKILEGSLPENGNLDDSSDDSEDEEKQIVSLEEAQKSLAAVSKESILPSACISGAATPAVTTSLRHELPHVLNRISSLLSQLAVNPSHMSPEDLSVFLIDSSWRSYRLLSRVNVALLRVILEDERPSRGGSGVDDNDSDLDDDDDLLFGSGKDSDLAPTTALLSPLTWPEVLRLTLQHSPISELIHDVARESDLELLKKLKNNDYHKFTWMEKLAISRLLMDAVCCTENFNEFMMMQANEHEKYRQAKVKEMKKETAKNHEERKKLAEKWKKQRSERAQWRKTLESLQKASKSRNQKNNAEEKEDKSDSGESSLSARQKAKIQSKREEVEKNLQDAMEAENISMLKDAIKEAEESGCGFEARRGEKTPQDIPILQAMMTLSRLEEEQSREEQKQLEESRKLKVSKKYEFKIQEHLVNAQFLGKDRYGNCYWLYPGDPRRIWIQKPVRNGENAQLSAHQLSERMAEQIKGGDFGGCGSPMRASKSEEDDSNRCKALEVDAEKRSRKGRGNRGSLLTEEDQEYITQNLPELSRQASTLLELYDPSYVSYTWSYIDTLDEIEALKAKLDPRGKEESKLRSRIFCLGDFLSTHFPQTSDKIASIRKMVTVLEKASVKVPTKLQEIASYAPPDDQSQRVAISLETKGPGRRKAAENARKRLSDGTASTEGENNDEHSQSESSKYDAMDAHEALLQHLKASFLGLLASLASYSETCETIDWLNDFDASLLHDANALQKSRSSKTAGSCMKWAKAVTTATELQDLRTYLLDLEDVLYEPQQVSRKSKADIQSASKPENDDSEKQENDEDTEEEKQGDDSGNAAMPDGWSDGASEQLSDSESDDSEDEDNEAQEGGKSYSQKSKQTREKEEDGDYVLWKYRSQRRRWRQGVRKSHTIAALATNVLELHERASAAKLADNPVTLVARSERPWMHNGSDHDDEDSAKNGDTNADSDADDDEDDEDDDDDETESWDDSD